MVLQDKYSGIRVAKISEKEIALDIITKSFVNDPGLQWMLKDSNNPNKLNIAIGYLLDEIFETGIIYITNDNLGVSLWVSEKKKFPSLDFILRTLLMPFKLRWSTIIRLLNFQYQSHKQLPNKGTYLYLVNLAVLPRGRGKGLASKLLNPILDHCTQCGVPIYLETANSTNVTIYNKKGFKLTSTINFGEIEFYYMKK